MFHYINGKVKEFWSDIYINNDIFWLQVFYKWNRKSGEYFLHPIIDDNSKAIYYYAFDKHEAKVFFWSVLKISGIWPKTAFQIANIDKEQLQQAISDTDFKFFEAIPGIGPKSSKRILVELKSSFAKQDLDKIDIDQKLYKDIIKTMKWLWYESDNLKSLLQKCPIKLYKENLNDIIKRVISNY